MTHSPCSFGRIMAVLACALTTSVAAQPVVNISTLERVQARYRIRGDARPRVEIAFEYTPSTWKSRFDEILAGEGDLALQFGGGGYATLDSNVPLRIGGVEVPAGIHRVRLRRDAERNWSLTLLEAQRANELGSFPGEEQDPPVDRTIPLAVAERPIRVEMDHDLRVDFVPDSRQLGRSHLRVRWHRIEASVEVYAAVTTARPRGLVDIPPRPWTGERRTDSGLVWTRIQAGDGAGVKPSEEDAVVVRYTMWRPDGSVVDRTQEGRRRLVLSQLVPGMQEALKLMEPGAIHHVAIPSQLAYGDRGAGPNIPAGTDLTLRIELLGIE